MSSCPTISGNRGGRIVDLGVSNRSDSTRWPPRAARKQRLADRQTAASPCMPSLIAPPIDCFLESAPAHMWPNSDRSRSAASAAGRSGRRPTSCCRTGARRPPSKGVPTRSSGRSPRPAGPRAGRAATHGHTWRTLGHQCRNGVQDNGRAGWVLVASGWAVGMRQCGQVRTARRARPDGGPAQWAAGALRRVRGRQDVTSSDDRRRPLRPATVPSGPRSRMRLSSSWNTEA